MPFRLLVATTNRDKLGEIRAILAHAPVELLSLDDLPPIPAPDETGATFRDNAALKARYYARHLALTTVAEDSGLVIDALGGEPGIHSARYLGVNATNADRFADISRRLDATPTAGRAARFICAVAVANRAGQLIFEDAGTIEGEIARTPSGRAGFGYDPIFFFPPYGCTLADVDRDAKLRVAHRGQAFTRVAAWLSQSVEKI